jgi:rSAM/selenodomain-associated transferase 2/rSAM/selenodomain-associated transferase 1
MKVHKQQLIIFTRYPEPGITKTRLIPLLGAEGAAELQRTMTEYTVRQARKSGAHLEIRFTGGSLTHMKDWLGEDLEYAEQGDGDLGDRMQRAFAAAFSSDMEQVVIIGCDCPANDAQNLQEAFEALNLADVVIGPAYDGGYYLIGLCRAGASTPPPRSRISATFPTQLFHNIDWGGEQVFEQTMEAAKELAVAQLPKLNDVDLPEDIPSKISVIIPTLNEEAHLFKTLENVRAGFNVEIIVVDGGSTDATRSIFPDAVGCKGGRAAQQNLGASKATGELFLFLHADTELPEGWDWIIRKTLADPSVALGAFSFKVREQFRGQSFVENATNYRSRVWKSPYGDQGLFMRADDFHETGGFPDHPIMEDYALVHSVRKRGLVVTVPESAITSGRRWQQHGVLKVMLINKLMILGYRLGASPERLARFYRKH